MFDSMKRICDGIAALKEVREMMNRHQWSRRQIVEHQQQKLRKLISYAKDHSRYYAESLRDVSPDSPLECLPVLTKKDLVSHLDDILTTDLLTKKELESHLKDLKGDAYFKNDYRVLQSGGSSGETAIYVFSRNSWQKGQATTLKWTRFMGVKPKFPRWKIASICPSNPRHATNRLSRSLDFGVHRVLRINIFDSIDRMVEQLEDFQPDVLNGYPTVVAQLAIKQLNGELSIKPSRVSTSSEWISSEQRATIRTAWDIEPFNYYGMTELVSFGSDCEYHQGIHANEDMFIVEPVDSNNQPVADGEWADKILITNLFNYTQPLIRFEVTDRVMVTRKKCQCDSESLRVLEMRGRMDDVLHLPSAEGKEISVEPLFFRSILGGLDSDWQIVWSDRLKIKLSGTEHDIQSIEAKIRTKFADLGVHPDLVIEIEEVATFPRTPIGGKKKLVVNQGVSERDE